MNLNDIMSASTLKEIGKKTNTTPNEVESVLSTALPILIQSMANNAKDDEGAQSLSTALTQHAGSGVTGSLKNVDPVDGVKILKHVLGSDVKEANKSIAKKSGVKASNTAGILAVVAPLLMNALGKEKEESKTSDNGIAKLLISLLTGSSSGSSSILGSLLGASGSSSSKDDDGNDLLGSLLGSLTSSNNSKDDDDDDDSILDQVGSLAASLTGSSGKKDDSGLAGLLLNMLKSK